MDKIIAKVVALGVPGLVLLILISAKGLAGAAAIVAALAALGGPFGMLGGLAVLGTMVLVSDGIAKYGLDTIFAGVVDGLLKKGMSKAQIRKEIESYPISKSLKKKLFKRL